jgi:hypothetical protein
MSVKKMNQPNSGIKCMVNTCHYYMSGDHCSAEKIEVHKECSQLTGNRLCNFYT